MRQFFSCVLTLCLLSVSVIVYAGDTNAYNPYMHSRLPSKQFSGESADLVESMGARASSLQEEARHRQLWKQEVYPVVFGEARAPSEIIFFLDYAKAESAALWGHIVTASRSLDPRTSKIVVMAKNSEQYGTELMGGGIWVAHNRPSSALEYFTYTLQRWNAAKNALAGKGLRRSFVYEYDATSSSSEQPILYSYLESVRPQIPTGQIPGIVKHAFDAGNVNMYQAVTASEAYDVDVFPAVVVNGRRLKNVSAQGILKAVGKH